MPVPETSVNEDHLLSAKKNQIRCARQTTDMQSVAASQGKNQLANKHFRLRILGPDTAHSFTSLSGG